MKKGILIIGSVLFFFSCKKEEPSVGFEYFDFSFDNTFESSYSIQVTPSDSIYIREHWNGYDSTHVPKAKTNYVALMSRRDREVLEEKVSKIKLKQYDTLYFEDYSDGTTYGFFIDKDSIKKRITVHSHNAPHQLDSLASWLYQWKKRVKLTETNKSLTFVSSRFVLPPPPPHLP